MPVSLQSNLNELDSLLADLNSAKFEVGINRNSKSATNSYCDYYSDIELTKTQKNGTSDSPLTSLVSRKPKRPPKLMHVLKDGEKSKIHDLAKENRENVFLEMQCTEEGDYGDYTSKWEYLGKGIWENQDYGSFSNCSTLKTQKDDYDYSTITKSSLHNYSEDDIEKEIGAGPRGERSKFIPTDHGEVKSKYHYLGFGLWENTDPSAKIASKKLSPPPLPPKAEPVWYNCTVEISSSLSSKELDDLSQNNFFEHIDKRFVETKLHNILRFSEPYDEFIKEDMSDMFKRAMLEKLENIDNEKMKLYVCAVCNRIIKDKVITAISKKYHTECFVCTYCRKGFKDKIFKTNPNDEKPYCIQCFEKLLGHYGNAHGISNKDII